MSLLVIACALFGIGLYGTLVRRDIIAILASIEVMLAGPLLLLVGLGASLNRGAASALKAEGIALVVIVVAAAEAAVGLALLVAVARRTRATRLDDLTEMKG